MSKNTTSETEEMKEGASRPLSLKLVLRILGTLGRYIWLVFLANVFLFICIRADMLIIREIRKLLDRDDLMTAGIFTLIGPIVLLAAVNRLFGWSQWMITIFASNRAIARLRVRFFERLQDLSKSFHDRHKAGWLVARNTGDIRIIEDFMTFALMIFMVFLAAVGCATVEIARISGVLLLPCILIVPIVLAITITYKHHISIAQRAAREQHSRLVANMTEAVRGVRVVHAFSRQEHNLEEFNTLNLMHHDTEIRVARLNSLFIPSMDFLGILNTTIVIVFGSWLVSRNATEGMFAVKLSTGDLVAYMLYMNVIIFPVRLMVELYSMAMRAMAAAERVFEVIDMEPEVQDPPSSDLPDTVHGRMVMENVGFRYAEDKAWILRNFSLEVPAGRTIALVGETGAGKTTVSSLLARFYDVQEGRILLDGVELKSIPQDLLHHQMGIVLQEGFLFSGTVLDNLRFRSPDMAREEVVRVAKDLGTHDAIMSLSDGYETLILEGGSSISEGQRQIVSITRALIANPKILVLDEPTSSLDVHTEHTIQNAIEKLIANRTTIVIAHRLSTVRHADRIVVIDDGAIIEDGDHDSLMKQNGRYYDLVVRSEESGILQEESGE
ncbi:MAG: ABC transporter ATP-binding protein [Kiritimatiellia bacterium]|nr:ABC transporter ATP-binding protein [Kiritimatiellia bacterium]